MNKLRSFIFTAIMMWCAISLVMGNMLFTFYTLNKAGIKTYPVGDTFMNAFNIVSVLGLTALLVVDFILARKEKKL